MNGAAAATPAGKEPAMTLRLARDDRLARMAASGDTRAFAAIYERYHQPIYRYCHSILRDPDDAADALQNAMLKAMRSLQGNDRDIALKPWLFRIAHNEAISLVRRRRPTAALDAFDGPLAHSADEDAATRERLTQLVDDLRELPDRQRGALLMRELAGLGFGEIADIFGVSQAAAKQTVYEARTALHDYVEGRHMRCEDARQSLSAGDRRMLRGRKLSAHLRDCAACRDFQEVMRLRSRDVAALAPPISAATSAAILKGIVGAGGGGAGGGGILAWVTGGGAKALAGSQATKSLVAAALVTASAGAIGAVSALRDEQAAGGVTPANGARDAPALLNAAELRTTDGGAGAERQPAARRQSRRSAASSSPAGGPRRRSQAGGSSGGAVSPHSVVAEPAIAPRTDTLTPALAPQPPDTTLPQITPALLPATPSLPPVATTAGLPIATSPAQPPAAQLPPEP